MSNIKLLMHIIILMIISSPCFANDFLMSTASFPAYIICFFVWLVAGLILKMMKLQVKILGIGGLVVLYLSLLLFLHFELALIIWSFYLALSFFIFLGCPSWFAEDERTINIYYYGGTLLALVVSAIGLKFIYYSDKGGFQRYVSNFMELSHFMISYAVLGLFVFFYIFYLYSRKTKLSQEETD
ncbi:MAG: hypothetical protein N2246_08030 [Candidatus Sumerlaeia bacterium]|nr:hypothetical protein [Candidatus Sumerlaeia bacterium]